MKSISYSLFAAAAAVGLAYGQTATTNPVGYTTVTCPAGSDTIVGVPLRQAAVVASGLQSAPSVAGSSATLTITGAAFTANQFANTHFVRFKTGASEGKVFAVVSNTTNALTVDLNGASLTAATNDQLEVVKFWTLAELINPATATDNPATTPNAIVASGGIGPTVRKTEVLVPNLSAAGINIAPSTTYYIHGGIWKKQGGANNNFNADQLWPDSYIIIRNPASIGAATKLTVAGEVVLGKFTIPLTTQASTKQDNFVAIPRPVDVAIKDLGLTSDVFTASGGIGPTVRQDEILVFDNVSTAVNKAPSATYYFHAGIWKKQGGGNADFGSDLIPAGGGFIIRKVASGTGATALWTNTATY